MNNIVRILNIFENKIGLNKCLRALVYLCTATERLSSIVTYILWQLEPNLNLILNFPISNTSILQDVYENKMRIINSNFLLSKYVAYIQRVWQKMAGNDRNWPHVRVSPTSYRIRCVRQLTQLTSGGGYPLLPPNATHLGGHCVTPDSPNPMVQSHIIYLWQQLPFITDNTYNC